MIFDQYSKIEDDKKLPICTNVFTKTMGLPCSHQIEKLLAQNECIPIESIHTQWLLQPAESVIVEPTEHPTLELLISEFHLKFENALPHEQENLLQQMKDLIETVPLQLSNPTVAKVCGRPTGAKNKSSTQRDLSEFEHVMQSLKIRKCSHCQKEGHNKRTCPDMKRNTLKDEHNDEDSFTILSNHDIKSIRQIELGSVVCNNDEHGDSISVHSDVSTNSANGAVSKSIAVPEMYEFCLSDITDVKGDGHCGFRAAAFILYETEDRWMDIRLLLKKQFEQQFDFYTDFFLYKTTKSQQDFIAKIEHEGEGSATRKQWFISPEMSQILADATRRIVVVINNRCQYKCNTFLPLFGSFRLNEEPITLVNMNGNHWVAAKMNDKYLPPLDLAWTHERTRQWSRTVLKKVESKMNLWREHFPVPRTRNAGFVDISVDV